MTMKVFISWSGQASNQIATCLREVLPFALMRVSFWMSATDISPGSQWSLEIRRNLSESTLGIVCLTPENLHSPWIYYESGALAHAVGTNLVIPYLYNISTTDLKGPLALFHAVLADEDGTKRLFRSINQASGNNRLSDQEIDTSFSAWWPKIKTRLDNIFQLEMKQQRSERELLEELLEVVRQAGQEKRLSRPSTDRRVGTRRITINIIHEISVTLLGMGLLSDEMKQVLSEARNHILANSSKLDDLLPQSEELFIIQNHLSTESRLCLYKVRNFLSHMSEARYLQAANKEKVDMGNILREMVHLFLPAAEQKGISFDLNGFIDLPETEGIILEIRRLFYNILDNALKYSSIHAQDIHRVIRISSKVLSELESPKPHFSIIFQNYGIGINSKEIRQVFKAGFRGKQAMAEVPVGSGIGLSEALKIIIMHQGEIKVSSQELYGNEWGGIFLTSVELLFL